MLYALLYFAFEDIVVERKELDFQLMRPATIRMGARFLPTTTAVSMRARNVIDGPIWRGEDDLLAIEIIEASCLDEAITLASSSSNWIEGTTACEIRPVSTYTHFNQDVLRNFPASGRPDF
jgi:hypothetical protein